MRIIKFRGKSNHPESIYYGKFVYGSLITRGNIDPLINTDDNHCPIDVIVDPNTVGQFTCIHDKNGNEIYEGDILKVYYNGKIQVFGVVVFKYCRFYIDDDYNHFASDPKIPMNEMFTHYQFEVIGNIHDNKVCNEMFESL